MGTIIRAIALLALLGYGGYHLWQQHEKHEAVLATADINGFMPIPRGNGVDPKRVIILAAQNCPRAGAQRAQALARKLADRHIPYAMWNQIHFNFSPADAPKIPALNTVMNGTIPIVLVNGRGQANPSLDQVVAEYNQENDADLTGD